MPKMDVGKKKPKARKSRKKLVYQLIEFAGVEEHEGSRKVLRIQELFLGLKK
jgi:hypothetical protein